MVEQSRETPAALRSGEPVATKLLRIGAKARQEQKLKFVNFVLPDERGTAAVVLPAAE